MSDPVTKTLLVSSYPPSIEGPTWMYIILVGFMRERKLWYLIEICQKHKIQSLSFVTHLFIFRNDYNWFLLLFIPPSFTFTSLHFTSLHCTRRVLLPAPFRPSHRPFSSSGSRKYIPTNLFTPPHFH